MVLKVKESSLGIIGLGFLGKILSSQLNTEKAIWGTWYKNQPFEKIIPNFYFDWSSESSWDSIPSNTSLLIITVPPLYKNLQKEQNHLKSWGFWMQKNRPKMKRLIYVSTTGVYPKKNNMFFRKIFFS